MPAAGVCNARRGHGADAAGSASESVFDKEVRDL